MIKIEWRGIKEFEKRYKISNLGQVKSLIGEEERIMKPSDNGSGYLAIAIRKSKKYIGKLIHRAVAEAFIENPKNKEYVNHIDGEKYNNSVENLEWVTPSESMDHSYIIGLHKSGENRWNSKLSTNDVKKIRISCKKEDVTQKSLAKKYGVSCALICRIVNNKQRKHDGIINVRLKRK